MKTKYRNIFYPTFLILIGVLIAFQSCKSDRKKEAKPNIVFIITDDQGWGDLGINGNSNINTPNIDKLARNGAQFSRFYVSPVCSPTRAEVLTGRYHPRGGIYDTSRGGERLNLDEQTIAEIFKSNGYKTAGFGKWHNGSQPPYHPNNRGFDEFYGFCSGHWGNYFDPMLEKNGRIVKGDGFIIDDLTNKALEYIKNNKNEPFFTYIAYNTPHSPMQVPDKWWNKYKNIPIDSTHRNGSKENVDMTRAALALCENIDWNVGRVIDKLDSLELLENTIVVYMSDNGPNGWRWNDELKGKKGHTDEGGVRSPFIMHWKDKLKPQKIDRIAGAIDILPSLTNLANISYKSKNPVDGKSLKPLLFDSGESWDDRYIFSHWNGKVSVRNQQYMLDHNNEFYDLMKDPGQHKKIEQPTASLFFKLSNAKKEWTNTVLKELNRNKKEIFPVGFKGSKFTQLPARDGKPSGNILRSNRFPNSSYFTNWTAITDSISWNCNIHTSGNYKATIYYTCKKSAIGSTLVMKQGKNEIQTTIKEAHNSPFIGVEFDRVKRMESYEKGFKALDVGIINMDKGYSSIVLKASEIKGYEFLDFRLLILEYLD